MTTVGPLVDLTVLREWIALVDAAESTTTPCREAFLAEFFFSTDPAERQTAAAWCSRCPSLVNDLCGAYAEAADERHGVWGGVDRTVPFRTSRTTQHAESA